MKIYKRVLDAICLVLQIIAAVMVCLMVLIITYQVIMRYFFSSPPKWSEEVSLQLMIWFCFIAMMLGVKQKAHIAIELFMSKLPPKAFKVVDILDKVLIMVFGAAMGYCIIPYVHKLFTIGNKLPATQMPAAYQYAIVIVAGFLIAIISLEQIILQIKGEENND